MSLEQQTTFNGLNVCNKCGWPTAGVDEERRHRSNCLHIAAGKAATELAETLNDLPSTKCGYGTGYLTFELDHQAHIELAVHEDGTFRLERAWLLDDMSAVEAAQLVRAIADWRTRAKQTRESLKRRP